MLNKREILGDVLQIASEPVDMFENSKHKGKFLALYSLVIAIDMNQISTFGQNSFFDAVTVMGIGLGTLGIGSIISSMANKKGEELLNEPSM